MDAHAILTFIHVLLFVFWLGTDVGVFIAAKRSERADLSVETRGALMNLGMVLDRLPRSALILIVPTGMQLAVNVGAVSVPVFALPALWLVSVIWLIVLWVGFMNPQTPTEQKAMLFNFAMNGVMVLVVLGYFLSISGNDAIAFWLKAKILAVGLIFVAGVALDALFKPAVEAFVQIMTEGASDELNARYSKAIGPVYNVVLLIYVLVAVAAWFGVTKMSL